MPEPTLAADGDQQATSKLLLVTGPGRSGTSAVTGALSQLGVHVPPPLVDWNRSNTKGFYETRWVVDFQREVLKKAHTYEFDADPLAPTRVTKAVNDTTQKRLNDWLAEAADGHQQMVIKDPRSVWLHPLWTTAATESGLTLCYLTMLRHPTEVVGSRSKYYGSAKDPRKARDYMISKVAGWINVSLLNERQTRGRPRAYVRYTDLLADWRTTLGQARDAVGLEFNADLSSGEPNPVDEFISPELHRVKTSWDELDVPAELQEIAEQTWTVCSRLADDPDAELAGEFDELSETYAARYRDAAAISSDTLTSAVSRARDEAAKKARKEIQAKLDEAQAALAAATEKQQAAEEAATEQSGALPPSALDQARRLGSQAVDAVRRRLARR